MKFKFKFLPFNLRISPTPRKTKRKVNKPLKDAIKLLNSKLLQERRLGSERLLLLNNPDSVPFLIKHLEPSEDREILENIIQALRNSNDIRGTEKLITFIKSYPRSTGNSSLVARAIDALADSKDPRGADFIYSVLRGYRPHPATNVIYMSTIYQLGNLRYKKAFNNIFKFIPDKSVNKYLREYAVDAIVKINKKKAIRPLLEVFKAESVDWPFRRKIINSITQSENGKKVKELENYKDDMDPYISESIRKYLNSEVLFDVSDAEKQLKKGTAKYIITNEWWHDVIEYRRWINDLFKSKFKVKAEILRQNEPTMRDLKKDCKNESDFNTLILNLASQIDTTGGTLLNTFIPTPPKSLEGSLNKLEAFLRDKVPNYDPKIISNLRIIHRVRSKKHPIHITSDLPEILIQLGFYSLPPDWGQVWEKLKEIYLESLKLLKESLENIY